jgi:hypothetical protein
MQAILKIKRARPNDNKKKRKRLKTLTGSAAAINARVDWYMSLTDL